MPAGALVRVPASLSKNGACKTNLRGVNPSAPYDYVRPSRTFIIGAVLGSISTVGSGAWSNTVRNAYYSTDSEQSAVILYPSLVSTSTSGTLLIRIYIQEFPPATIPPGKQTVFQNGSIGTNGYGVFLQTIDNRGTYVYTLYFGRLQDDVGLGWVQMNQDGPTLNANEWNQFSVQFTTGGGKSVARIYQNGSFVRQANLDEISTPAAPGTTELMNFFGRITDFALLDTALSDTFLAAYGSAPYL